MVRSNLRRLVPVLAALTLVLAACGGDDASTDAAIGDDRPTVVVTTNILGDVVTELVGDQADVVTIMPVGADPHDFQPSAREVDRLLNAQALIANGRGFEEGLLDVIDSARDGGVPTFEATEAVATIEFAAGGHDEDDHGDGEEDGHDEDEDGHGDEDEHGDDEDGHGHEGDDPHFFTDPARMAEAIEGIGTFLAAEVPGLDTDALDAAVQEYGAELMALDADVESLVDAIPEDRRVLVTNHEVFGYFADRYGFEVVGAAVPSGTTVDSASAGELAELAEIIEQEGVPAIFADTSSSSQLIETLASEVGDVAVVELYSESLGEPDSDGGTYLTMVRANATRISAALS